MEKFLQPDASSETGYKVISAEKHAGSGAERSGEVGAEKGRDRFYGGLRERIGVMTELRGALDEEGIRGKEFVRNANAKIDDILGRYRDSVIAKLNEKERLGRKIEEIDAEIAGLGNDLSSPEVQKLDGEGDRIREMVREIKDDPDVRLFNALSGAKVIFEEKARRYEEFVKNPAKAALPPKIKNLSAGITGRATVFSSLSISFLLNDEEMESLRYDPSNYGVHFGVGIFNIIRKSSDPKDVAESIRHENTHSIYEAFDNKPRGGILKKKDMKNEIDLFLKAIDTGSPTIQKLQFDALVNRSKRVVFSSKGELIANFDELRSGRLHTELASFYEIMNYLQNVKSAFENPANNRRDGTAEIGREYINRYLFEMRTEFDSFYRLLADLFFVAEHERRIDELKSSMILFDAAEYGKIAGYFRHEIGEEKYRFYEAVRSISGEDFFNIPRRKIDEIVVDEVKHGFDAQSIANIAGAIRAHPDFLTSAIKQEILLSLDSLESKPFYIAATAAGVGECENAYKAIISLAQAIGGGEEYAESAVENLLNSAFLNADVGDSALLDDVLANLNPEHDKTISRFTEDYIRSEISDNSKDKKELKISPLWQKLISNGRTKAAALSAIL